MKYEIEVFDSETGEWRMVYSTNYAVRVRSNQYVPKIVFETDDPEYNG